MRMLIDRPGSSAPSVSTLYASALGAFLSQQGAPTAFATSNRAKVIADKRVQGQQYAQQLAEAVNAMGDATLGFQFGTRVGGGGFGLLGLAAATSTTLKQAIFYLTSLESLTSTLGQAHAYRHGKRVSLVWQPHTPVPATVVEAILAGWVSFGRHLLAEQVAVQEVAFAHRPTAAASHYESQLACPIRFNAPHYQVIVATELLDAKPQCANPTINAALAQWISRRTAGVSPIGQPMSDRIARRLGRTLPLAEADELTVAAQLGIGRRTLQRGLQQEGVSFRHLLDAARAELAVVEVLRGKMSLLDLCGEIGFEEQTSLCRSFRKWTGYSPVAFRQALGGMFGMLRE